MTDPDSTVACRERIESEPRPDGIAALVNNAGSAVSGPIEFVPLDDLRMQLEVNLIGQVAMLQALIPSLRKTGGRIVNVTSIGGIVASPFMGPYAASKFGLEAMSDSLRNELRPWGIETIAIEPGSVATEIWETGARQFESSRERMPPAASDLYGRAMEAMEKTSMEMGARGIPTDSAAALIEQGAGREATEGPLPARTRRPRDVRPQAPAARSRLRPVDRRAMRIP